MNIPESSEKTAETAEKNSFRRVMGYEKREDSDFIQILSNVNRRELSTFSPS